MATIQDACTVLNALAKQATGTENLTATDVSSFVSVMGKLTSVYRDNLFNALSQQWSRTIFAVRPYDGDFKFLDTSEDEFGGIIRKVSFLDRELPELSFLNTAQNPNTLADGQTVDQYEIRKTIPIEMGFVQIAAMNDWITRNMEPAVVESLKNYNEFMAFYNAAMIEYGNQIETRREAGRRMVALNAIAGVSAIGNYEVDLTKEFNDANGTKYTRAEILGQHFDQFLKFFIATLNNYSDYMTERSVLYHEGVSAGNLMRHTPKRDQRLLLYKPLFNRAGTEVLSTVFHRDELELPPHEYISYWQSNKTEAERPSIDVKPVYYDAATETTKVTDDHVQIPFVVGCLYDRAMMGVNHKWQDGMATPPNARGRYVNYFWYALERYWNDFTEKCITFVMGEGGE